MKMITIKGLTTIFDGEREIDFKDDLEAAWGYVMLMTRIRPVPCTKPALHPVRGLVAHPKPIELTEEQNKRIKAIKQRISNKNYSI